MAKILIVKLTSRRIKSELISSDMHFCDI